MERISTVFYTVNYFDEGQSHFIDFDALLNNDNKEFEDVYRLLNSTEFAPNQSVIDRVINYSKQFETANF